MRFLAALGGNIGAQPELFSAALRWLQERGLKLHACSSLIRTAPVGTAVGHEFLNAAALLDGSFEPQQVLQLFQEAENLSGRTRAVRWGPRTLDLDLLLAEDVVIHSPDLMLPHPAMWYRDFVLRPASEIAGDLQHPLLESSVRQLFSRLQQRPLRLRLETDMTDGSASAAGGAVPFLAEVRDKVRNAVRGAEWLLASESGEVFAEVRLVAATAQHPPCSYPLPQPASRQITLYVESLQNAVDQLEQLCVAIGCSC
jgi:2-amino-4-hydroxy-6-hydroxymethyldihydropteridine diphosphokinase